MTFLENLINFLTIKYWPLLYLGKSNFYCKSLIIYGAYCLLLVLLLGMADYFLATKVRDGLYIILKALKSERNVLAYMLWLGDKKKNNKDYEKDMKVKTLVKEN